MGDTDIFSDMALINELHQPDIGIVPIGDRFTMGGAVARSPASAYFSFKTAIPATTAPSRSSTRRRKSSLPAWKARRRKSKAPKPGESLSL